MHFITMHTHIPLHTHKVVDCGAPNNPANGDVAFTLTVYNAFAVYSCEEGYNLVPTETFRTCEANGNWSGDDRACQRKHIYHASANLTLSLSPPFLLPPFFMFEILSLNLPLFLTV